MTSTLGLMVAIVGALPAASAPVVRSAAEPIARPPATAAAEEIAGWADVAQRMAVPVRVNGRGPYRFMVDTGADRSVVSRELASELALADGPRQLVHGVNGAELTPAAEVASLEVGARKLQRLSLPTLPQADMGGAGILGLDALAGQKVVLDFTRKVMRIEPSRGYAFDPDAIVVRAKRRFGQLVLVDSSLGRKPVYVILDSGAQSTIANAAFRRLIKARPAEGTSQRVDILSVTGQVGQGERDVVPELKLGDVVLRQVPVVYSELHTFQKFDLAGEPAMLLGVDVMSAFRQVEVDFARRDVRFGFRRDERRLLVTPMSAASRLR